MKVSPAKLAYRVGALRLELRSETKCQGLRMILRAKAWLSMGFQHYGQMTRNVNLSLCVFASPAANSLAGWGVIEGRIFGAAGVRPVNHEFAAGLSWLRCWC